MKVTNGTPNTSRTIYWDNEVLDAIVFDFDGTLVTLEIDFALMRQRVAEVVERYGICWDSLTERFTWERICEARSQLQMQEPHLAMRMAVEAEGIVCAIETEAAKHARLAPGAVELLRWLKDVGVKVAVVTRNCNAAVETVLAREPQCREHIDVIVPRDGLMQLKPHPRHLQIALERLDVAPSKVLCVGDSTLDIEVALKLGCRAVGVAHDEQRKVELLKAGAHAVIRQLDELMSLLTER
ncbi:MAG TPA: HAD family hydrolase [Armatimonadetes bacterium]|nr:HAD family hydrolase [Armatimonadota bacterium]